MELAAGSGTLTSKGTHRALEQRRNERNMEGKNVAETEKKGKREKKENNLRRFALPLGRLDNYGLPLSIVPSGLSCVGSRLSRLPFLVAGPSGVVLEQCVLVRYVPLQKVEETWNACQSIVCAKTSEGGKQGWLQKRQNRMDRKTQKRTGETGPAAGRLSYLSVWQKLSQDAFSY